MAGRADLFHLDQQRVAIAIKRHIFDRLRVPARFAFHPKFLARAAPEMRLARRDGLLQRRAVHPRHHQHAAGFLFLDDRWNQTVAVKFQLIVKTHLAAISPQSYEGTMRKLPGRTTSRWETNGFE